MTGQGRMTKEIEGMIVFGHPTFFAALRTRLEAVFLHVVVVTVTSTMVSLCCADVVGQFVFAR